MEKQAAFEKVAQIRAKLMLKGAYEAGFRDGMEKKANSAPIPQTREEIWNHPETRAVLDSNIQAHADRQSNWRGSEHELLTPAYDAKRKDLFKHLTNYIDPTKDKESRLEDGRRANTIKNIPNTNPSTIKGPSYWDSFKKTYGLGK